MRPVAHVAHAVPGRVRIRIPSKRGDTEYFAKLQERLETFPAIIALRVNPKTGSVLIEYDDTSLAQLKESTIESSLFSLEELDYEPKAVWQRASSGFEVMDSRIKKLTRGDIDLRSVLFIGLVTMGIRQLTKGQVMGPAMTLFWQALGLIVLPKVGKK